MSFCCDALLSGFNLRDRLNSIAGFLHVLWGEVTEGRVLRFGKELVVCELPGFAGSLGEHFLEVIFN